MPEGALTLVCLLAAPVALAMATMLIRSARAVIAFCAAGTLFVAALSGLAVWRFFSGRMSFAAGNWFVLDALSAYHLAIMVLVFSMSAIYAVGYFREEIRRNELTARLARRYGALWFGSLGAMILVVLSNNLVMMWVGIEATTLLTAFLICTHVTPTSLEALWKYLLMCSVGVAVAFIGTLLVAASTAPAGLSGTDALLWTNLMLHAGKLNPALLKAGFIFLVVGYGTKAGLAPMHNWLPDAHSQAPAPVSAVFSGFLLNSAFFCILRYLPLVEQVTGNRGWGRGILVLLGLLSIMVAAVFIVAQRDVKRLLAYSSVEHIGIMSLGVGLGGIGCFAAMFHMLNHSVCKTLSFFSAGMLGRIYGTHDMHRMTGVLRVSPVWGTGLIGGMIALIGVAPFSLFLSEFMILKAAIDGGGFAVAAIFLAGLGIVFIAALRFVIAMSWEPSAVQPAGGTAFRLEGALVPVGLLALLALGLWMPQPLADVMTRAALVLGGRP